MVDFMQCDKFLIELKDAVYLWVSANPITFGILCALIMYIVRVTPWKWDDQLVEKLKWWRKKNV